MLLISLIKATASGVKYHQKNQFVNLCQFYPQSFLTAIRFYLQKSFFFVFFFQSFIKKFIQWRIMKFSLFNSTWFIIQIFTIKYSYLSKLPKDNGDILAAFLSKSYCALFCLIFLSKILT